MTRECPAANSTNVGSSRSVDSQPLKVVPQGLRAFDAHDAYFFLELLPGPRDRDGLPECIRFWKSRIEGVDRTDAFSVGLIYGPSGCGKSSLVKAGLLPALSKEVITVYLEASADETESGLLRGLRTRCAALEDRLNLTEAMAALRRGQGIPVGKKVLIVIDQLEQWLHANRVNDRCALVQALRQCDGDRVQCIAMVRDDFWLGASRFMSALEVDLLQGRNTAMVDLFDLEHAQHVLAAFGRAFGRLPQQATDVSNQQKEFVKQAVAELADEGKVVCVRLAMFAEMMKCRPWTLATLNVVGGIEGIGVTFLEETFSAQTAQPQHRLHRRAAESVLNTLLPASATSIKGQMKSYDELLAVSGYAHHGEFDELIKLLDSELRLITPDEAEKMDDGSPVAGDDSVHVAHLPPNATRHYQLTHDYLVSSVRDWLTRKQRATRRGRAELQLAELADLWNAKPETRHLPAFAEYLRIVGLTAKKDWSPSQRDMMREAARVHIRRWGSVLLLVVIIAGIISHILSTDRQLSLSQRTRMAVDVVEQCSGTAVAPAVEDLFVLPAKMVRAELQTRHEERPRLPLAFALAAFGRIDVDFLAYQIGDVSREEVDNLVDAFAQSDESLRSLHQCAVEANTQRNWRLKARLASVALQLEDLSLAREMCQLRSDPMQRTIFIDETASWHGDVTHLAELAGAIRDPALRSGIFLAIGSIPDKLMTPQTRQVWQRIFHDGYVNSPDTGTHSAASWALRHWNQELPDLPEPMNQRDWYLNSVGMTMLKIPPGSFSRTPASVADPHGRWTKINGDVHITISRQFLLADREVSLGQFRQFINDADYPAAEKPTDWPRVQPGHDYRGLPPSDDHPAPGITWVDAVLFCNWLSSKEGLDICYERVRKSADDRDFGKETWHLDPDADGYRLPTEAEWEHACRAGTETFYSLGSFKNVMEYDITFDLLDQYAVYRTDRPEVCGAKLPNGWGLFDLHGNLWEWCHDHSAEVQKRQLVDPRGPDVNPRGPDNGTRRVERGGCYNQQAQTLQSSGRFSGDQHRRDPYIGFRPARSQD